MTNETLERANDIIIKLNELYKFLNQCKAYGYGFRISAEGKTKIIECENKGFIQKILKREKIVKESSVKLYTGEGAYLHAVIEPSERVVKAIFKTLEEEVELLEKELSEL